MKIVLTLDEIAGYLNIPGYSIKDWRVYAPDRDAEMQYEFYVERTSGTKAVDERPEKLAEPLNERRIFQQKKTGLQVFRLHRAIEYPGGRNLIVYRHMDSSVPSVMLESDFDKDFEEVK